MKNKLILAITAAAVIAAASLFAVGDDQPTNTAAPAPAATKADGGMKCHSTEKAAPMHGCCMMSAHGEGHADGHTGDAGASCHKK
jgi:hypothetical protein